MIAKPRHAAARLLAGLVGLAGVVALARCGGADSGPPASVAPMGWIADVVRDPARFQSLMDRTGRDGWIALHKNDYAAAIAAFPPGKDAATDHARARAELDLAVLDADLARLSHLAHERLFTTWDRRGGLPAGSAAAVAAMSASCAGQPWKPWADRIQDGPGKAFFGSLGEGASLFPTEAPAAGTPLASDPFAQRRVLHAQALAGDPGALLAVAAEPLVVEPADGFERKFYDPCVFDTLSKAWMTAAAKSLGAADPTAPDAWKAASAWATPAEGDEDVDLAGLLFAPWLTADDLKAEIDAAKDPGLLGATMPSLDALGVARTATGADEIEPARDEARKVMDAVDDWRSTLQEGVPDGAGGQTAVSDDGKALLLDLRLAERFRQEWLVARGRLALVQDRPHQALAYLELARDVAEPAVGPNNSPAVLALLAEAELRNGHTREALDALRVLHDAHPEIEGLEEITGDLAVLEGLDRRGDSKEN